MRREHRNEKPCGTGNHEVLAPTPSQHGGGVHHLFGIQTMIHPFGAMPSTSMIISGSVDQGDKDQV